MLPWSPRGRAGPRQPFPAWAGPAERLRYLLAYAVQAPSRHNAQPWLFEIEGSELRLLGDPRRALKAADPHGREMAMACGAALENLCLAAAWFGHEVEVEEAGERGVAGTLLARAWLGGRRNPSAVEEELFRAIPLRRSATAFHSEPVPPASLALLGGAAGGGAQVRLLPPWLSPPVADLVAEADAIQWSSGRFRAELAAWTRTRVRNPVDGLGAAAPQGPRAPGGLLRRLLRRGGGRQAEAARRAAAQTRALVLLSSAGDGPRDWLGAGRALQRLLLRVTALGLHAGWYAQAAEVPEVRQRLRRTVGGPGHPQVLLRVGHGVAPRPTPRRPVELVLRSLVTEVAVDVAIGEEGQQAG
jgi:hypothetical protein